MLVTVLAGTAGTASAALPVLYDFPAAVLVMLADPGASPPGANDFSCRPTAAHPYPVVLVHGTFGNQADSWQALSPLLKNDGYCVFSLNYGGAPGFYLQGYGDIPTSARQLAPFVDRVRAATGAARVDLVGHSQGGLMARYYLKYLDGAAAVHRLVGLAPSNHGTNLIGVASLLSAFPGGTGLVTALCVACTQQFAGSSFLTALNAGGDTVPGVSYTVIETIYDEIVTSYTSAFLSGPNVTNITLQDHCLLDLADHLAIEYDPNALRLVENALDPAHRRPTTCYPVLPVLG